MSGAYCLRLHSFWCWAFVVSWSLTLRGLAVASGCVWGLASLAAWTVSLRRLAVEVALCLVLTVHGCLALDLGESGGGRCGNLVVVVFAVAWRWFLHLAISEI